MTVSLNWGTDAMGVYSTVTVTRERAEELIREHLGNASDEAVSLMLFYLFEETVLHNYWITYDPDEANWWGPL